MYAVIATGGKQYRVEPGSEIDVERLKGDVGDAVDLTAVLLVDEDGAVVAGRDLDGRSVSGTITGHHRGEKIRVFTYKNKSRQHKRRGHRQEHTRIRIEKV